VSRDGAQNRDISEVRAEDGFSLEAFDRWFRDRVSVSGTPHVEQFTGGVSNLTFRVSYGDQRFVVRKPPRGHRSGAAHDMKREYDLLSRLSGAFPYAPKPLAFTDETSVIGETFYAMEHVDGTIPRPRSFRIGRDDAKRLCERMVDVWSALHHVDLAATGLDHYDKGDGYARRQIEGWTKRYGDARTWNVPSFRKVTDWLSRNVPADGPHALIHNDFRLDNLVLRMTPEIDIRAVLDWELATVGCPWMDVGAALAYWTEENDDFLARKLGRQPTDLPGMFTRSELLSAYRAKNPGAPDDWTFYEVYGLFRLAGIAQQIYRRYHDGATTNTKYRSFWIVAHYLEWRCLRALKRRV
jgi:aminoglycoside phosphotransferase (APT) family kinase protein